VVDPLAAKQAAREATETVRTFGQCADELIRSRRREWRSEIHARQWRTSIDTYCRPILDMPVAAVDTAAVLLTLQPIWGRLPETSSRVRGRIEAVLDYAKAHGWRHGENVAVWRGHLSHLLSRRPRLSKPHYAAMPYQDVPAFLATIRESQSIAAMALEFLILVAARSGEVLFATWPEVDLKSCVWSIPAERMKSGIGHRVPLSGRAVEILKSAASVRQGDRIFTIGPRAMRVLCPEGATVHGFRSAFRDWCAEETSTPREICEAALAHATGNAVELAYRRGDALEKRRGLMAMWADYCAGPCA
jgi:integrase